MHKSLYVTLFIFGIIVLPVSLHADEDDDNSEVAQIAEGGRLYDKWWQVYDLKKPSKTHPAYPAKAKKSGATTWRCKECHGWDYRGKDGAYAKGSHYTGIIGIRNAENKAIKDIVRTLKNETHQYDKVMLDSALELLALFVSKGQVDHTDFVDDKTGKATGDIRVGQHVFADKCVRCHGLEGNDINFGDKKEPEYVGTVASHNPWEAIHKIHNGHPGAHMSHRIMHANKSIHQRHHIGLIAPWEPMPSMRLQLSNRGIRDLLSYLQTLPTK